MHLRAQGPLRAVPVLLCVLGLHFAAEVARSQSAEALDLELRRRADAQAAAKRSGDLPEIVAASRSLAALVLRLLADSRLAQADEPEAIELYRQSLAMSDEPVTAYSLAKLYLGRGEKAEARRLFESLLDHSDDRVELRLLVAGAYLETDHFEEAIRELEAVLARDADQPRAHLELGRAYWLLSGRHNNPRAEAAMRAAVAADPSSYEANYYLGQMESQRGDHAEAARHLRAAAALRPRSPDPWFQLGFNAFAEGDSAAARAHLGKGVGLGGEPDEDLLRRAHAVLSRLALSRGDLEEAERFFLRGRELRSGAAADAAPEAASDAPTEATRSRRRELAEALAGVLLDWGSAEASRRDFAEATRLYRAAERWNPDTPLLMRRLGLASFQAGDYAQSARALALAVEAEPQDRSLKVYLALALASSERYTEAAGVFSGVEDLLFDNPRTAYVWALSLVRSRQPERAKEVLTRLGELPLPPPAMVPMAALHSELGDHQAAVRLLEAAAEAAPDHPGIHKALEEARRRAAE